MRHALALPEMATANLLIGPPFHLSFPSPSPLASRKLSFVSSSPRAALHETALSSSAVEKAAGNTILVTWHTDTELPPVAAAARLCGPNLIELCSKKFDAK